MINISKLYCGLSGESDHLRYSTENSFGPVIAYNCTSRCNLNCLHCYSSSTTDQDNSELSTADAKQLIRQLAEANCPVVLFTGGEPLLRTDLFELLTEARQLSLRTVLSTNGTLIDQPAAEKLAEVGVSYVGISIDGEESFHDKFRQSPGCFEAALTGIENCQKANLKTGLRFTITKQNIEQIPAAFDIAAKANIRRICFYHLVKVGRAKNLDDQSPASQQPRTAVDKIIEKTKQAARNNLIDEVLTVGNHADGPYLLLKMTAEANPLYEKAQQLLLANGGNKTGEKIACVGWDGNVYPDQFWRNYSLGNIKDKSFAQIWDNPANPVLEKLRRKSEFADKRCRICKWFDLCKGNFRFLGSDPAEKNWLLEPPCYLADSEIKK